MALIRAFQRQLEKRTCPVCGIVIVAGKYRSHINACFMDSDDDDCKVVAKVTPEDKKRRAMEQMICLDDSRNGEDDSLKKSEELRLPKENNQQPTSSSNNNRIHSFMKVKKNVQSPLQTAVPQKKFFQRVNAEVIEKTTTTGEKIIDEGVEALQLLLDDDFEKQGRQIPGRRVEHNNGQEAKPSTSSKATKRVPFSSGKKRPAKVNAQRKVEAIKRPKQEICSESPKKIMSETEIGKARLETRSISFEATASSVLSSCSPRASGNKEKAEEKLNLAQVVEKVHNFLESCQTELSPLTKVPSSMTTKSNDEGSDDGEDEDEESKSVNKPDDENSNDEQTAATSPYYLTLFMKVLKRVFYEEPSENSPYPPSFWGENLRIVGQFISVSEKAKQLFVKLFIRKRRWLLAKRLNYESISRNLVPMFEELEKADLLEPCRSGLSDLSEAIRLLHVSSLKLVAKNFHVNINGGKLDITRLLLKVSRQKNVFGATNSSRMLQIVKEHLGPCYRIAENVWRFFNAVFTLYSPSDMSSSQLLDQPHVNLASQFLFLLLQLATNEVRFPAPSSPQLIKIYNNQEMLIRYVVAKELEGEIADAMGQAKWDEVYNGAVKARDVFLTAAKKHRASCEILPQHLRRFTDLWVYTRYVVAKELEGEIADAMGQAKWDEVYNGAVKARDVFLTAAKKHRASCEILPQHLRRFTDLWVYTRCISHGIEALQRLRKYDEAVEWLRNLLSNEDAKFFVMDARGSWWDRLALNLDSHLKQKDEALQAIIAGLKDICLGDKDRLLLQDRGEKIDGTWKGPLNVPDADCIRITGSVLGKNLGDSRTNRFMIRRDGTSYECSVEGVALNYCIKYGYEEGVHGEGTVWHTVFGLLCYDIIFDHQLKDIWFSETQTNPADLNSRNLYAARKKQFDERFAVIENSTTSELIDMIKPIYDQHYGETNSETSWEVFTEFAQLKRFVSCCKPMVLTAVFRRLVSDYRNCRSGFPDLTVWNSNSLKLAVIEVKGPGDKLSTKQRLWLHYFANCGVTAQVCYVAARNSKRIDDD
ncbi:Fanconi-associated nuclease 1 -like protein [Toxocara canis]|uniref:Fanconi-associated nuclease n=1 Tax=Toxocara canis TaxID=6265 RepID=A0A0B2UT08_TOXCA|nr:Fanconi-associated nuclease 1 -like protein [Toxocara canis]